MPVRGVPATRPMDKHGWSRARSSRVRTASIYSLRAVLDLSSSQQPVSPSSPIWRFKPTRLTQPEAEEARQRAEARLKEGLSNKGVAQTNASSSSLAGSRDGSAIELSKSCADRGSTTGSTPQRTHLLRCCKNESNTSLATMQPRSGKDATVFGWLFI